MAKSEMVMRQLPVSCPRSSWNGTAAARFCTSLSLQQPFTKMPTFVGPSHPARFLGDGRKGVQVLSQGTVAPSMSPVELLNVWNDEYNGVVVEPTSLLCTANAFASALRASLSSWRSQGKKGIWLKLLEEQAELVPIAIQEGFAYHHAEPGYVMLTYWIPNEPCSLPSGPSHQIGVAGFVINDNKEILVVKKKCSCSCCGVWKLPTGYMDKIDTSFLELVAFRHVHQVAFEKSDLLFVCMLKPLSSEIKIDENEIQDAKWITVDELQSQEFYEEDEMWKRVFAICMAAHENMYDGFIANQVVSKFDGKLSYLYYIA
ncbi:UNVERIFIED_CONTAM: Nudix hydrolase 8 [Sesamum radiatum]|uniref:Nudix hydrolase 8 n=1 Tax=Sesamum radiatum TaxID=300843 RepID=A0AAW2NMK4_SESRA